jgi:hypothetical protein
MKHDPKIARGRDEANAAVRRAVSDVVRQQGGTVHTDMDVKHDIGSTAEEYAEGLPPRSPSEPQAPEWQHRNPDPESDDTLWGF